MITTPLDMTTFKPLPASSLDMSTFKPLASPQAATTAPKGELRPREGTPLDSWLSDLEGDIRFGGGATVVGRTIGRMEGRGSRGMSPLGDSFMSSPETGLVHTAQGVAQAVEHPPFSLAQAQGLRKAAGGVMEAATIPLMMTGPEEAIGKEAVMRVPAAVKAAGKAIPSAERAGEMLNTVVKAAGKISKAIPSAERAGEMLNTVMGSASNLPVNLSRSGDELMRAVELEPYNTLPKAVRRLIERYTAPLKGAVKGVPKEGARPLTYKEARDAYNAITGKLSDEEISKLTPVMKRQMVKIAMALKDDIGDTAAEVGQAARYYAGMKEYAQAKRLAAAAKLVAKLGLGGLVAGGGVEAGKMVARKMIGSTIQ